MGITWTTSPPESRRWWLIVWKGTSFASKPSFCPINLREKSRKSREISRDGYPRKASYALINDKFWETQAIKLGKWIWTDDWRISNYKKSSSRLEIFGNTNNDRPRKNQYEKGIFRASKWEYNGANYTVWTSDKIFIRTIISNRVVLSSENEIKYRFEIWSLNTVLKFVMIYRGGHG